MATPLRRLTAAAAALAMMAWAAMEFREAARVGADRVLLAAPPADYIAATAIPYGSEVRLARARIRSEAFFPPDRDGAVEEISAAMPMAPLRSESWLLLGREQVFRNHPAQARAALLRADALDPVYPAQRLRAIQLWSLLGDEEQARSTARRVAAFGRDFRARAADELTKLGHDPLEIFALIGGADLAPAEQAEALVAVRPPDAARNEALFALVPDAAFADPAFRRIAYARAIDPVAVGAVTKLWAADQSLIDAGAGLRVADPDLLEPPFAHALPLGWQPAGRNTTAAWQGPSITGDPTGALEVKAAVAAGAASANLQYTFLRMPVPEGAAGEFRVPVRCVPADGRNRLWLTLRDGGKSLRSESLIPLERWEPLTIKVPEGSEGRLVEIVLEGRLVASGGASPAVYVGALELRPREGS